MHIENRKTLVATQKPDKAINSFCQKCIRFHIVCHLSDSQEAIALNGNYVCIPRCKAFYHSNKHEIHYFAPSLMCVHHMCMHMNTERTRSDKRT